LDSIKNVRQCDNLFATTYLPGLPQDLSYDQNYQFGYILEGLGMEAVGIFYGHLVSFLAIW
jgi:hypothetical protein